MNINVYIDRIVLDGLGLEAVSSTQLKAAIAAELQKQFSMQGSEPMVLSGRNETVVSGAPFTFNPAAFTPTTAAKSIGSKIGQSVFRSLSK